MRMLTSRGAEHYAHWVCCQCTADAYLRQPIKGLLRLREVPNCPYCSSTMQLKKKEQNIFYQKQQKLAISKLDDVRVFVIRNHSDQHGIIDEIHRLKEELKEQS